MHATELHVFTALRFRLLCHLLKSLKLGGSLLPLWQMSAEMLYLYSNSCVMVTEVTLPGLK